MYFLVHCYTLNAFFFFFNDTATTEIYTLSLHDALPICASTSHGAQDHVVTSLDGQHCRFRLAPSCGDTTHVERSEEHTSELQSLTNLVCRLLLEKKKNNKLKEN